MIQITTLDNSQVSLDDAMLQEFESAMRGEVLTAEHSGYDEARSIFNAMIDKRPALIARCTGVADVIQPFPHRRRRNRQGYLPAEHTRVCRRGSLDWHFG